ncbi:MAG: hypothetical protein KDA96_13520 [Planctomycetaceae bacterium]|nr:hypothetical protein [Planctomycetaceae bacterium]
MKWTRFCCVVAGFTATLSALASPAAAQGLLYYLPEDGQQVEYEGILTEATSATDENPLKWNRELIIRSVGREDAEFNGEVQPCRWIEIKLVTGQAGAEGIVPGPVGSRVYKLLVPESRIMPEPEDDDTIPNDMIPIVRGYRRLGEESVQELNVRAVRIYPTICLLTHYDGAEVVASNEDADVLKQNLRVSAKHMKGKHVMERPESRSTNDGEYWVTQEVPFGIARWVVTVTRETKESTAARDAFKVVSILKVDMKLRDISEAESELQTP